MVWAQARARGEISSATRDPELGPGQVEVGGRMGRRASRRAGRPCRAARPAGPAASRARATGNGTSGSSRASRSSSSANEQTMPERAAQLAADREALEVPGHVLAQVGAARALVGQRGQQLGMPAHDPPRPRRGSAAAWAIAGRRRRPPGRGTARAGRGSRGRRPRRRPRSGRPSAARRRPPRCRRCRAPGWRRVAFSAAIAFQSAWPE